MSTLPWLRLAAPYRDAEVARLQRAGYVQLRAILGSVPLRVPEELEKIGCTATLQITENRRKILAVTVTVMGPDAKSMTADGFKITPRNKITPIYDDGYDD